MDGWVCTEIEECDIRNPLPWPSDSCESCYISHVVEHITPHQSFRFFQEVYRILKPGGIFRVVVPVLDFIRDRSHAVSLIIDHGHVMVFSYESLAGMLFAAGFERRNIKKSRRHPMDSHHIVIGLAKDDLESIFVEATK